MSNIIPTLPYNIQNGDPIDATQVQGNLNAVVQAVNTNAAPVAGVPTSPFAVGNAVSSNQAVNLGQAQAAFAALNGSSSNNFSANTLTANQVVSNGDVVAYSDERLKSDWHDLPELTIADIAGLKIGSYVKDGERSVGGSAQSIQAILPGVVRADSGQYLAVDYGKAAFILSVMLARRIKGL